MEYKNRKEFELVLVGLGRSVHTVRAYHNDLRIILPLIDEYSDTEVQKAVLILVDKGYSPASLKRILCALKTYCNIFEIHINFSKVGSPKVRYREASYITDQIFVSGINKMIGDKNRTVYSPAFKCVVFEILYKTGIRVDELLSLTPQSYDRKTESLQIIGKGSKQRRVPINKSLVKTLCEESFANTLAELSKSTVTFWTKKYFGKEFSPHSFRHGYTTKIIKNGVSEKAVKSVLGHESFTTTLRYFHMNFDEIKESVMSALN